MVPRLADNLCRRETKQVCNTVNECNLCEIFYCTFKQRRLSDLEYLLEITVQWNPALWWPSFYDHLDILAWTKALWAVFLLKEPLLLWPIGDWINRVPLCSVEEGICKNFFYQPFIAWQEIHVKAVSTGECCSVQRNLKCWAEHQRYSNAHQKHWHLLFFTSFWDSDLHFHAACAMNHLKVEENKKIN